MLTLAIESSDRLYSIALLQNSEPVAQWNSLGNDLSPETSVPPTQKDSPQSKFPPGISVKLFPALQKTLASAECTMADVELVTVTTGPGLFTGLRVGVVAAKTLAWTNRIPLVGVHSLEVVARQAWTVAGGNINRIKPVVNAQRQQLFAGCYGIENDRLIEQSPAVLLDRQQWMDQLEAGDLVSGNGLKPLAESLNASDLVQTGSLQVADPNLWAPTATESGRIGIERFRLQGSDDLLSLEPFYFRPSAAEEKSIQNHS